MVWHDCVACGHGWPFPYATAPTAQRDWRCPICIEALAARAARVLRDLPRAEIHGSAGGLWVKASDLDAALEAL